MAGRLIVLEFLPDQYQMLLDRRISATVRVKKAGMRVGDCFYAGRTGLLCVITSITKMSVDAAAHRWYWTLGYDSLDDFLAFWRRIHPHIGDDVLRKVFVIFFAQAKSVT